MNTYNNDAIKKEHDGAEEAFAAHFLFAACEGYE